MIQMYMREWPVDGFGDVTHSNSEWTIATDATFLDIVDSATTTGENLTRWTSEAVLPTGTTWHGRCRRVLSDGSKSSWNYVELTASGTPDYNDFGTQPISRPSVILEEKKPYEYGGVLTFLSSPFQGSLDTPKSTTWAAYRDDGTPLFLSLEDEVNVTQIDIPMDDLEYSTINGFSVHACHHGEGGGVSDPGSVYVSLVDYYITVISQTRDISPFVDYKFRYKKKNDVVAGVAESPSKFEIWDIHDNVIMEIPASDIQAGDTFYDEYFIIPAGYLEQDNTYRVMVYMYGIDTGPMEVFITTLDDVLPYSIDESFVYQGAYTVDDNDGGEYVISTSTGPFCATQNLDNTLPMMLVSGEDPQWGLYRCDDENGVIATSNRPFPDISTAFKIASIHPLKNNEILIDGVEDNGATSQRKLIRYNYQALSKISEDVIDTVNATSIEYPRCIAIDHGRDKLYYLRYITDGYKLVERDIYTGDEVANQDTPITNPGVAFEVLASGHVVCINSVTDTPDVYVYTPTEAEEFGTVPDPIAHPSGGLPGFDGFIWNYQRYAGWSIAGKIPPAYVGKTMFGFVGKNGDLLFFQDNTAQDNNSVLVFDHRHFNVSELPSDVPSEVKLTSTIRMRDGSFLRYAHSDIAIGATQVYRLK